MTNKETKRLRALCATKWRIEDFPGCRPDLREVCIMESSPGSAFMATVFHVGDYYDGTVDKAVIYDRARGIIAAHNALPALLDEVERLRDGIVYLASTDGMSPGDVEEVANRLLDGKRWDGTEVTK